MSAARGVKDVRKCRMGWLLLLAFAGPQVLTVLQIALYVTRMNLLGPATFWWPVEIISLLILLAGVFVLLYWLGRAAWLVVLSLAFYVASVIAVAFAAAFLALATMAP